VRQFGRSIEILETGARDKSLNYTYISHFPGFFLREGFILIVVNIININKFSALINYSLFEYNLQ